MSPLKKTRGYFKQNKIKKDEDIEEYTEIRHEIIINLSWLRKEASVLHKSK